MKAGDERVGSLCRCGVWVLRRSFRRHDVGIRWRQGEGLVVSVDGRDTACRTTLGLVDIEMKG